MTKFALRRDFAALEVRRRSGVALLKKGLTQTEVARRLGVSRQAVQEWWATYQQGGWRALRHQRATGRPRLLTAQQNVELLRLLQRGALSCGFATDLWNLKRVAELIQREFGVTYHRSHVHRILLAANWSCQVPALQARERDEGKIRQWLRTTWREAKKKPEI